MKNAVKMGITALAIAAAISIGFAGNADADFSYRRGFRRYGHGFFRHGVGRAYYGHGFGFRRGHHLGYGYGRRSFNSGAVRIEVNPKASPEDIQVFVDEGHVGVVDDFDGAFQRLHLPPGKHEIELRLEGYQSLRTTVFVTAGRTYHLRGQMKPLAAA